MESRCHLVKITSPGFWIKEPHVEPFMLNNLHFIRRFWYINVLTGIQYTFASKVFVYCLCTIFPVCNSRYHGIRAPYNIAACKYPFHFGHHGILVCDERAPLGHAHLFLIDKRQVGILAYCRYHHICFYNKLSTRHSLWLPSSVGIVSF